MHTSLPAESDALGSLRTCRSAAAPAMSSPETGDAPLRSAGRLSEMSDQPGPGDDQREISDLIGVQITLAFMVWLLAMLAAFFFVGAVAGVILVFVGVIGFGWYGFSAISRADQS